MNKYVYTITTVLFLIIAGFTVSAVLNNEDDGATAVAVEMPETTEEVSESEPEEIQEPEPVVEEPVVEEPEETIEEPEEVEETTEEPVEEDVTYYVYTVKGSSWLNLRAEEGKNNNPVATLPRGYTGYVVKMTGHWTLVCADGYIGYCSDSYLDLEEIAPEDFPDELKGYDESSAGSRIAEGKIGEVEESNEKSVKWL